VLTGTTALQINASAVTQAITLLAMPERPLIGTSGSNDTITRQRGELGDRRRRQCSIT